MSLVGSDTIAGSCCTMLDILHNLVQVLDVPVGQAVAMLTENPARCVGTCTYIFCNIYIYTDSLTCTHTHVHTQPYVMMI